MGGVAQQWMAPFALTIACSVLVSLFVSFSLDPMLSAYWPDPHRADGAALVHLARPRALQRLVQPPGRSLQARHRLGAAAPDRDGPARGRHVRRRAGDAGARAISAASSSRSRTTRSSSFAVETPPGSNLDYTTKKVEEIRDARASQVPGVTDTYATIGGATGAVDEGQVYVGLIAEGRTRRHQEVIARTLRQRFKTLGGVTAAIQTSGLDNQKQIQIQISGPDVDRARTRSRTRRSRSCGRCPAPWTSASRAADRSRSSTSASIARSPARWASASVDVAQALRPAFAGVDAGDWVDPTGKTRDVTRAARAGSRARARPTCRRCRSSIPGPDGQPNGAARPDRARSVRRSARRASITSIANA